MKIGIFGGTFNPVHNGHIRLVECYLQAASLDKLLIIPARVPPHKAAPDLLPGEDRLEMCRLAFDGLDRCEVNDMELRRPQKSYTVETLEQLHRQFPSDSLCLLMGSDMFFTITEWKDWRRILQLASLCVGKREWDLDARIEREKTRLEELNAVCEVVRLDPIEVSSTEIRTRIQEGKPITGLVPDSVASYIHQHGLYL